MTPRPILLFCSSRRGCFVLLAAAVVRKPDLLVAELAADGPDLRAEGGGEHHHLLGVGRLEEDLLHLGAHVCAPSRRLFCVFAPCTVIVSGDDVVIDGGCRAVIVVANCSKSSTQGRGENIKSSTCEDVCAPGAGGRHKQRSKTRTVGNRSTLSSTKHRKGPTLHPKFAWEKTTHNYASTCRSPSSEPSCPSSHKHSIIQVFNQHMSCSFSGKNIYHTHTITL